MEESIMRYLVRYIFLWTGFLVAETRAANGFDPVSIARQADSLSALKQFYTASILFRKAAFHSEDARQSANFLLRAAQDLVASGNKKEAVEILSEVPVSGFNDSLTYQVKYNAALYSYLNM